jgi:hypothetical protein
VDTSFAPTWDDLGQTQTLSFYFVTSYWMGKEQILMAFPAAAA